MKKNTTFVPFSPLQRNIKDWLSAQEDIITDAAKGETAQEFVMDYFLEDPAPYLIQNMLMIDITPILGKVTISSITAEIVMVDEKIYVAVSSESPFLFIIRYRDGDKYMELN